MAKLFLSYSRKDDAKARRFTDWLEREGHDVWRDEDDIGGGTSFSMEIEKALEDSDAVLVLWSANSVKSEWVRDEAGYGRDAGKLIPLLLDGTDPPLGFRQHQSIELLKWKGREPSAAERIKSAIARLAEGAEPNRARPDGKLVGSLPAIPRAFFATGILVLVGIALLSLFLWRNWAEEKGITILVSASPNSPDRATAADYANVAAADMAAFLPTRFDGAKVMPPGNADARGYHIDVAVNRRGQAADATLTLSDRDGRSILWSRSWSVPDISGVDLRQEVSRFASRAALCLTDAEGGSERLIRPALDVYISGCVGWIDSTGAASPAQLSTAFERAVALAPDFPPGWAYVAVLRSFAAENESSSGQAHAAALRKAREAIATARRLNPHSGMAYLAESMLIQDDRAGRLALLDKGADVDATNPLVQSDRAEALGAVGRMTESVQAAKRAVELDPLMPYTRSSYIVALTYAGQFSRARAEIANARKKWPNDPDIDWAEFSFQYRYGDPHAAEQLMPRVLDYSDAQLMPYRKLVAARINPTAANVEDVIGTLRAQSEKDPDSGNKLLLALGLFGKFDEVHELLSDPNFQPFLNPSLLFRPEFAPVRADPRFISVAARAGLVRYWRESGDWPDFCTSEQLKYDCKTEAAKYRD